MTTGDSTLTQSAFVVAGVDGPLGVQLVTQLLDQTSATLHVLPAGAMERGFEEGLRQQVAATWGLAPGDVRAEQLRTRLLALPLTGNGALALPEGLGRIDAVWNVGPTQGMTVRATAEAGLDGLRRLFALLEGRTVGAFHHVSTACVAGDDSGAIPEAARQAGTPVGDASIEAERAVELRVAEMCRAAGIPLAVYRPAQLSGTTTSPEEAPASSLDRFLANLFRFKEYLDEKVADYLQRQALLLAAAPPEAGPNVLSLHEAVEGMLRISRHPRFEGGWFHLASPRNLSLSRLCEAVAEVSGLKLRLVPQGTDLGPADTLLQLRTGAFASSLLRAQHLDTARAAAHEGLPATGAAPDEKALVTACHQRWEAARREHRERSRQTLGEAQRRTIDCGDGTTLEYLVAGTQGPALVCINALGQDLVIWNWLVTHFSKSHRVFCWKPRGTYEQTGRWHTLMDQVADLERIVEHENLKDFRVITWCSGAKVGVEFLKRRPLASALVIMNGTFKAFPGLEQLETPFEQMLFKLCQMVAQKKELAGMVMKSMKSLLAGTAPASPQAVAKGPGPTDVLSSSSRDLKAMIVEPFEDAQSTVNYSLQVVNYLSHDVGPALATLEVPVLFISGQYDRISSPVMSRAVAKQMPCAYYREVVGGTHYCLYETPEVVIDLVERFFEAPRSFEFSHPEIAAG